MTKPEVISLLTHMEWADALVWTAVLDTESARTDASVLERLHHVHLVQRIYLQLWRREPHEARELTSFADIDELYAWVRENYRELRRFIGSLEVSAMQDPITFPWSDELVKWFGEARTATVHETMQQVAIHTAHHRGQLTTTIRQLGGTPPLVDFIAWIWMGKPGPEWPSSR